MTLEILDCEQRSAEWFMARCGLPTASEFDSILANGTKGKPSKTRQSYMRRLAAEIITGQPGETYESAAMARGRAMEPEARNYYSVLKDADPTPVGFVKNGRRGCSPDALLGDDGLLEIKTQRADLLVDTILKGEFPKEHVPQCQGQLWITEREWLDLIVYWPGMPPFVKRAYRDDAFIASLDKAVDRFLDELDAMVAKVRAFSTGGAAAP